MGTLITRRIGPKEGSSFDGMTLDGHGDEDDVSCRPDILEDIHNHSIGLGETSSRNARRYPYRSKLHWDHLQQTYRYLRAHIPCSSAYQEKNHYTLIFRFLSLVSWNLSDACLVSRCHTVMMHCRDQLHRLPESMVLGCLVECVVEQSPRALR